MDTTMLRATIFITAVCCCLHSQLMAQTVQLPSFRFFGVSTTVLVPDRGAAVLGGNSTAYSGSQSRGLPLLGGAGPLGQSRGIAQGGTTGQMSVTAQIHDLEAMDTAVLGMPVAQFRQQVAGQAPITPRAESTRLAGSTALPAAQQQAKDQQLAREHFDLAREAYQNGKIKMAQSFLKIALQHDQGELCERILYAQARLNAQATTS
jgi:hypothetical protein